MSVILLEYEFIRMDGDYCEVAVFKSREMNFNLKKKIYPREKTRGSISSCPAFATNRKLYTL